MIEELGFEETVSDKETTIVMTLLNPCKAIMQSKKKGKNLGPSCDQVARTLTDKDLDIYKNIFSNNNREQVTRFFKDPLIRKLWEGHVQHHLTFKDCFKNGIPDNGIVLTYKQITKALT